MEVETIDLGLEGAKLGHAEEVSPIWICKSSCTSFVFCILRKECVQIKVSYLRKSLVARKVNAIALIFCVQAS